MWMVISTKEYFPTFLLDALLCLKVLFLRAKISLGGISKLSRISQNLKHARNLC